MRTPFPSLFLILNLVAMTPHLYGENGNHTEPSQTGSQSSTAGRATQAAPLNDREMTFISENFFISKLTVWNKYSEKLPKALEAAMKDNNETQASQVVADLMGMINGDQAKRALENATKERDSEKAKKPNAGDDRYIALMERLVWGAKAFLNDPSKDENADRYNKEFAEAFKNVSARNQEIREKIKQAADGNEQAKDWLRKNLDQSSLLSFAEGQKKYGNGELADRLIDAVSFKEGKNKFLDMSLLSETQRLHLGQTSKSVGEAVDKFFKEKQGFNGAVVSLASFKQTPMKQWYVDGQGALKTGAPSNFSGGNSVASNGTASQPATGASNSASSSSGSTGSAGSGSASSSSSSSSSGGNNATTARAQIVSSCRECHSKASIDSNGIFYKTTNSSRTKTDMLKALQEVPDMSEHFNQQQKAQLASLINQWVK